MAGASESQTLTCRFNSWPFYLNIMTLGKLITHAYLSLSSVIWWLIRQSRWYSVTAGLADSRGSLQPCF